MKIFTVIGARPQFIKAAALSRVFQENTGVEEVLVHTGQHYDTNMSDVFFQEMGIPEPKYNLAVGSGSHGAMTGRQLEQVEKVLLEEAPDLLLVYGDTNSTLAGALAAAKLHIPVAHVEAGLRSFNRRMPEEINRVLTDHASDFLFAPTETARENLRHEGIDDKKIFVVGDVMYDAALYFRERARKPDWFDGLALQSGGFVLCTIHRADNTDNPRALTDILRGLEMSERSVVLPMHPRTKSRLDQHEIKVPNNVHLVDPVGYLEMVWLESHCEAVATDSGGIQKEAFFHGKRCITIRDETEWLELVKSGNNILVGTRPEAIAAELTKETSFVPLESSPYGAGDTAVRVFNILQNAL